MPLVKFAGPDRPAVPGHPRQDQRRAGLRQPGQPLRPHRASTASPTARARSACARSGTSRRSPGPAGSREARMVFEKMLTYANHLGLYAEQIGALGRGAGQLPPGLHPPGPDQRRRQPRPGPGPPLTRRPDGETAAPRPKPHPGLLGHPQHRLDHVARVRGLEGLVHPLKRERLDQPVVREPALVVQGDQRADQRGRPALAAEDADRPSCPTGWTCGRGRTTPRPARRRSGRRCRACRPSRRLAAAP